MIEKCRKLDIIIRKSIAAYSIVPALWMAEGKIKQGRSHRVFFDVISSLENKKKAALYRFDQNRKPKQGPYQTPSEFAGWIRDQIHWVTRERRLLLGHSEAGRKTLANLPNSFPPIRVAEAPPYPEAETKDIAREAYKQAVDEFGRFLPLERLDQWSSIPDPAVMLHAIAVFFDRLLEEVQLTEGLGSHQEHPPVPDDGKRRAEGSPRESEDGKPSDQSASNSSTQKCEEWIKKTLEAKNSRIKQSEFEVLGGEESPPVAGHTVRKTLSHMVKTGNLNNTKKNTARGCGYGLPNWPV